MIEHIHDASSGIDIVRPAGTLTPQDYETVIVPLLDDVRKENRRLRCLVEVGPEFTGLTPAAAWEDVKLWIRALHAFEGCAVVSDLGWVGGIIRFASFLLPYPVRLFDPGAGDAAVEWLSSLPAGAGISHRLVEETGIVVVEVTEPLRTADFEELARTIDPWIEAHGSLRGLVLHAHDMPGWENIGGLVRHIRFVHDHHRRIRRVALSADGRLAALVPKLAEHFVQAEVRRFGYDRLEEAKSWVAAP